MFQGYFGTIKNILLRKFNIYIFKKKDLDQSHNWINKAQGKTKHIIKQIV